MQKETRKEEILRVAARLFKNKGYSAVTMRDLATEMGIKAASLYNHISSKQAILQDIVLAIAEDFTAGMHKIIEDDSNSIKKLEQIIDLHVKIAIENTDGLAALNSDWMHLEEKRAHYLELRQQYEDHFRDILNQGMKEGELQRVDVEVTLFSILSTLRSLYLWIPKKEDINKEALATSLSQILLNGINK
ncbi:TetR/AcrR family transcriptional regulator [Winogradskyella haliclonae]|uniref:HTH tetR-type domain-containing protein n=1 Tax=Winogradskyella haliclonae TaxID=2048558 RepID=A0ABQ2BVI9_9FLAO|nr:TetR/AcrR family transcriptional regulator [Winogradskyella haliclonae]GGI55753.1 hypothetical protein GCM10011444_00620 [Winogradskyella haliclonae]